jgi:hypothetical protein
LLKIPIVPKLVPAPIARRRPWSCRDPFSLRLPW